MWRTTTTPRGPPSSPTGEPDGVVPSERARPESRRHRRTFGHLPRLPSRRYRASYLGPDGQRRVAPTTFQTKDDADAWLSLQSAAVIEGRWRPARAVELLTANPCRIRGAGQAPSRTGIRPATLDEPQQITNAMPERYRLMVQLAAHAGATTRELMDRLGHSTSVMAMRYQPVADDRPAEIARRLSLLAQTVEDATDV